MFSLARFLFLGALCARVIRADFQVLQTGFLANESSVELSTGCVGALESSVTCDQWLQANAYDDYYGPMNDTVLDSLCTAGCKSSLASYRSNVVSSCQSDPQPFQGLPAQYFVDLVIASNNFTCFKAPDSGEYCNMNVPDYISNLTSSITSDTSMASLPEAQVCSPCILALGQLLQATSFSNYDDTIASEWASIQKTCQVNYPIDVQPPEATPTDMIGFAPTNYTISSACISGNTYDVVSGDDCVEISKSKSVSTGGLIVLNQLFPDCSNLAVGQSLCLPQTCPIYTIQPSDTCYGIAGNANITYTQLLSWNPSINGYCSNLITGQNICIGQPGTVWTGTTIAGATPTKTDIYASATIAPPGPTAHGTTSHCGKYYRVMTGDDCHLIALNYTIVLSLFQAINPDINSDCTNLVPGLFYCVEPTADWNDSSTSTTPSSTFVSAPAPTPTGTTPQCYAYHIIASGDYCGLLESSYGITLAQFLLWNPDVDAACSNLLLGEAYCVDGNASSLADATLVTGLGTSTPIPT